MVPVGWCPLPMCNAVSGAPWSAGGAAIFSGHGYAALPLLRVRTRTLSRRVLAAARRRDSTLASAARMLDSFASLAIASPLYGLSGRPLIHADTSESSQPGAP